jgi:uncharacterized RDD family membrane protein YckC
VPFASASSGPAAPPFPDVPPAGSPFVAAAAPGAPAAAARIAPAHERAGFWVRVLPFLVDVTLVAVVAAWVFAGAAFLPLLAAYFMVMIAWKGTTIGGAILRLHVRRTDGLELTFGTAAIRMLGMIVSALPLGLGFLWCAWSDDRLTWHDNIAGTEVVRLPPGSRML